MPAYRVTITYQIDVAANDEEQVLDSLVPLLPSNEVLGSPRIVIMQEAITWLPTQNGEPDVHALHCDRHLHRENPCTCG
jgi:hypothetical protein